MIFESFFRSTYVYKKVTGMDTRDEQDKERVVMFAIDKF